MTDDRWLSHPLPAPRAPVRLYCLPYAGGGASVFRDWPAHLGDQLDVAAFQLPGRENRLTERPIGALDRLVAQLQETLDRHLDDRPFALFGHSTGALVAFALTHQLASSGARLPELLFISATPAPSLRVAEPDWSSLTDQRLVAWLTELGGTPRSVLDNPDLMALLLPTLRADLAVGASGQRYAGTRVPVPIRCFAGADDDHASPARVRAWAYHCDGQCEVSVLPGDHFFLHSTLPELLAIVSDDLARAAGDNAVRDPGGATLAGRNVGVP